MRKFDQGLGTVGLLGLATLLAVLITLGIPIALNQKPLEAKDWLGFAGSVVGSMMTLLAATLAWRSVQRQLAIGNRQFAIQSFGILTKAMETLEDERLMAGSAKGASDRVRSFFKQYITNTAPPDTARLERIKQEYEKVADTVDQTLTKIEETSIRRWASPDFDRRLKIHSELIDLHQFLFRLKFKLEVIHMSPSGNVDAEMWTLLAGEKPDMFVDAVAKVCTQYATEANELVEKFRSNVEASKREVGL